MRRPNRIMAEEELGEMLDAVKREARSWFGMGAMRARRRLSNGARVVVSITMPPLSAEGDAVDGKGKRRRERA